VSFFLIYGTTALTAKKGYVYIDQSLADVLHSNLLPKRIDSEIAKTFIA
jgi:hypothetical protein